MGWISLILLLVLTFSSVSAAAAPSVTLTHATGGVYVVEDTYYLKENSAVYVGPQDVTVIGATWTPQTAELLAGEIHKVTDKPITAVIDPDYNPERAGGNAYWKSIGARIISTKLTYVLLQKKWIGVSAFFRRYHPSYPYVPLVLPTETHHGSFALQDGRVRALYLGPSHTPDGIFVYFPQEKVLYAGNILKEHLGNLAFADMTEYPKTLHKLKQLHLPITTVISGHWSAVHGPELIDQYLEMLREHTADGTGQ